MITVEISQETVRKARDFASKKQPTSYARGGETPKQQRQRITAGKIGEIAGQGALHGLKIPHTCPDKFKVVEREEYRNFANAVIYPGTDRIKKVDFKTAWRPFHKRILVPEDMFKSQYKDIYVGVKINLEKILSLEEHTAEVHGYVTRQEMETKHPIKSFGESPAYWVFLYELHPLQDLTFEPE